MATIDRRDALKRIALLSGGVLSAGTVSAVLSGCGSSVSTTTFETLNPVEGRMLDVLVEAIIPTTGTPGAREAGVTRFIDDAITHVLDPEDADFLRRGLADASARGQSLNGVALDESSTDQASRILQDLLDNPGELVSREGTSFFQELRQLTIAGYYTSEVGSSQEHRVQMSFPEYKGSVPYEEIGATWATNNL